MAKVNNNKSGLIVPSLAPVETTPDATTVVDNVVAPETTPDVDNSAAETTLPLVLAQLASENKPLDNETKEVLKSLITPQPVERSWFMTHEIFSYSPDQLTKDLAELADKHAQVEKFAVFMNADGIKLAREAMGISDNYYDDVDKLKASFGEELGALVAELRQDRQWDQVFEYAELISLLNEVNALRSHLGLASVSIGIGGKLKGNAVTTSAAIHPKRNSGFMAVGAYAGQYKHKTIEYVATEADITLFVDGKRVISWQQGENSLSYWHNIYAIRAAGASVGDADHEPARQSFPVFLANSGYNADAVMLQVRPAVGVSQEK